MKSMTGYGRGEYTKDGITMLIEAKSVNSRYLDLNLKSPRILAFCEDKIRKTVQSYALRGKMDIYISYSDLSENEKDVALDVGLLKGYLACAKQAGEVAKSADELSLANILRFPDVIKVGHSNINEDLLWEICETALKKSMEGLVSMRSAEGENLKTDILERLALLEANLEKIQEKAGTVVETYKEKLFAKISTLDIEIPEERVAVEVTMFADKASIDEEITRLKIHFAQCKKIMAEHGGVGRKLDFLIQEFNRETNTICSKSQDSDITKNALEMKNEIEKIREQVQNIE